MGEDKLIEFLKPCTWALLLIIFNMMKMTYVSGIPLNYIPRWLFHKDMLNKIVVEEDVRHIELMKRLPNNGLH